MDVGKVLAELRLNRDFMAQVVVWKRLRSRPEQTANPTSPISPLLWRALHQRGIDHFYRHQALAIDAALSGRNVIIATATASGKSLAYTVPVLQTLISQPQARALYLFPTKALAHDQLADTTDLVSSGRIAIPIFAYDGDTPQSQRKQARQSAGILITNPDMLHAGILPYHTSWRNFFAQLRYVVIDEIHVYRGVFGSHVANVLRRLRRLCQFYGSNPQFICCSATIANPRQHAETLVEAPFTLIDESQNGAPAGEKHFILYNPPFIDPGLGLRQNTVLTAREAAFTFLHHHIQTVVFARSRQTVELLLTYLGDDMAASQRDRTEVAGYRGGYLPLERRDIEQGLRSGRIRGVVATNALELGVDIGQLTAAILTGYPGSVAATWQQAGRAGRRQELSAVILVAGANPIDQYICRHPRYLFGQSPEQALINPNNLPIMSKHLLCAAFELPFRDGESFGTAGRIDNLLAELAQAGQLHHTRQQYHWLGEGLPAGHISLRTSSDETVVIQAEGGLRPEVIGQVDLSSAPTFVHEGAIYIHQARTYLVENLDWAGRIAHVRPVLVDYYTKAVIGSTIRRLAAEAEQSQSDLQWAYGEVEVISQATGYHKIKRYSHETIGYGQIDLPASELETTGYWLVFGPGLTEQLMTAGIFLRPNDYGPNWASQRQKALTRDNHRCQMCGDTSKLHIHHIKPFRQYPSYLEANILENLLTLCPTCHRQAEESQRTRSALAGLSYLLANLAPLYLMCDPADIRVTAEIRNPLTQAPTVVLYETVPAGVGFSQRLFQLHPELLASALELVNSCRCEDGCPACVGPAGESGPDTKETTRQLLTTLQA